MGTNYYVKDGQGCDYCGGTGKQDIHIGKSSAGWKFAFEGTDIKCPKRWFAFLENKVIWNEYGDKVGLEEFKDIVHGHRKGKSGFDETVVDGCRMIDREFS